MRKLLFLLPLLFLLGCSESTKQESTETTTISVAVNNELVQNSIPDTLYVYWDKDADYYFNRNKELIVKYDTMKQPTWDGAVFMLIIGLIVGFIIGVIFSILSDL